MKRQLFITGIIFLIMSAVNFFGGILNDLLNYYSWMNFSGRLVFVGVFCGFYLLTTRMNLRFDNSLKLPIIRTVCWTLLVLTDLFIVDSYENASYLLYLTNSGLCALWDTIHGVLPESVSKFYFVRYIFYIFIDIILFGLYEIGIIKAATSFYGRITRNQKQDIMVFSIS